MAVQCTGFDRAGARPVPRLSPQAASCAEYWSSSVGFEGRRVDHRLGRRSWVLIRARLRARGKRDRGFKLREMCDVHRRVSAVSTDGVNLPHQPVVKVRPAGSTWPIACTPLVRMAMGTTRDDWSQQAIWVPTADLPRRAGHPFFERLNQILGAAEPGAGPQFSAAAPHAATPGRGGVGPRFADAAGLQDNGEQ